MSRVLLVGTARNFVGQLSLKFWPQSKLAKNAAWQNAISAGLDATRVGKWPEAEKQFLSALKFAKAFQKPDKRLAISSSNLAAFYLLQDDVTSAVEHQERALQEFESLNRPDAPDVIRGRFNLAEFLRRAGALDAALIPLRKILSLKIHPLFYPSPEVPEVFFQLASIYFDQNLMTNAKINALQALWCWEIILGADHPDLSRQLEQMTTICEALSEHDEADAYERRRQNILESVSCLAKDVEEVPENNLGGFYDAQCRYIEHESLAEQELGHRESVHGDDEPAICDSLEHVARIFHSWWQWSDEWRCQEALANRKRALKIAENRFGQNSLETAKRLDNLAGEYSSIDDPEKRETLFQRALKIRERQLGPGHPDVAKSLLTASERVGNVSYSDAEGLHEAAQFPFVRKSLAIREQALGPDHLDVVESLEAMECLHENAGQWDEAERLREQIFQIIKQHLPPEHPEFIRVLFSLANFYERLEKQSKAEPHFQQLHSLLEMILGPDHYDFSECLQSLGDACFAQNKLADALPYYERALSIRDTLEFQYSQYVYVHHMSALGEILTKIAEIYRQQGDIEEAEKYLQRAAVTHRLDPDHGALHSATPLKAMFDHYYADGRYDEALEIWEQLSELWQTTTWMVSIPPEVPTALTKVANIYRQKGQLDKAEPIYTYALGIWEKGLNQDTLLTFSRNNLVSLFDKKGRDADPEPLSPYALTQLGNATLSGNEELLSGLKNFVLLLRELDRESDASSLEQHLDAINDEHAHA